MADVIGSSGLLEVGSSRDTAATVALNPRPPTPPEEVAPAQSDPAATQDASAQFRADMLLRQKAPLAISWRHGGLND
jgi:hypothetical protein